MTKSMNLKITNFNKFYNMNNSDDNNNSNR